jgi:DNA modification methylase
MVVIDQEITERYAAYHSDCMEVLRGLPDASIHLSVFSPPFGGLYQYSSSERDLSNCADYDEFLAHYGYVAAELARVTLPGRMAAVHCADVALSNGGRGDDLLDLPGDLIRVHRERGWGYAGRYHVWKEPYAVRMHTLAKGLAHQTVVEDSAKCSVAAADYLLLFRRNGENAIPIEHPTGFLSYAGSRTPPADVLRYRGYKGHQTGNKYSQWIWRQYASAFWDDVRADRVLPFKEARDAEDERHVHPLQLDIIERAVTLWSNQGERVLTPFMGVGSEVYGAVQLGRFGIGAELKPSYYRQAVQNLRRAAIEVAPVSMFDLADLAGAAGEE